MQISKTFKFLWFTFYSFLSSNLQILLLLKLMEYAKIWLFHFEMNLRYLHKVTNHYFFKQILTDQRLLLNLHKQLFWYLPSKLHQDTWDMGDNSCKVCINRVEMKWDFYKRFWWQSFLHAQLDRFERWLNYTLRRQFFSWKL